MKTHTHNKCAAYYSNGNKIELWKNIQLTQKGSRRVKENRKKMGRDGIQNKEEVDLNSSTLRIVFSGNGLKKQT